MTNIQLSKFDLENKKSSLEEFLPDFQSALLNSKVFANEMIELNDEKITHDRKSRDDMKRREQDQKQELLVALTNELFEKVEKLSTRKKSKSNKKTKTESCNKPIEKISKIEFTDISWYREKLNATKE